MIGWEFVFKTGDMKILINVIIVLVFQLNNVMGQDIIVAKRFCFENFMIGDNISENVQLKPINLFTRSDEYIFPDDVTLYFINQEDLLFSNDVSNVYDLFVVADVKNNVKLISIFFRDSGDYLEKYFEGLFGKCAFKVESSINNRNYNVRYIWISNNGIEYDLSLKNISKTQSIVANLKVYSVESEEFLGQWLISCFK